MAAFFPITQMINRRKIGFRVLSGQGATTTGGRLVFGIFTAIGPDNGPHGDHGNLLHTEVA